MIFFTTEDNCSIIEYTGCTITSAVEFNISTGRLKLNPWARGRLFEADEYFPTFCKLTYGFEPTMITNEECDQLIIDGVTFLGKPRRKMLHVALTSMLKKDK